MLTKSFFCISCVDVSVYMLYISFSPSGYHKSISLYLESNDETPSCINVLKRVACNSTQLGLHSSNNSHLLLASGVSTLRTCFLPSSSHIASSSNSSFVSSPAIVPKHIGTRPIVNSVFDRRASLASKSSCFIEIRRLRWPWLASTLSRKDARLAHLPSRCCCWAAMDLIICDSVGTR